jgi:hypothetical protein
VEGVGREAREEDAECLHRIEAHVGDTVRREAKDRRREAKNRRKDENLHILHTEERRKSLSERQKRGRE